MCPSLDKICIEEPELDFDYVKIRLPYELTFVHVNNKLLKQPTSSFPSIPYVPFYTNVYVCSIIESFQFDDDEILFM